MTDRLEIKAALAVSDVGEITGTAWPFGSADRVGDVIAKGAFSGPKSLPMLFAHDQGQVIGVWDEITETETGLTVKGRLLVDDVERAREVRAMIRAGAVSGLSIGFVTKQAQRHAKGRTITALELHEISVVAVPAHPGAQITTIKANPDPQDESACVMSSNVANDTPDVPGVDQKAFDEVKTRLDKLEAKSNRPGVIITGPEAPNAERKAFVSFLRRGVERIAPEEAKALTVANDASGGYLAPEEFGKELLKKLVEINPIRAFANVVQISAPEVKYPRRLTGTAATWVGEIDARTASGMTFEQVTITPHELATFTDVSNNLLEDNAYGLEGELLNDFAESFGKTESLAFLTGTGIGQPKGLITDTDIAEISTGSGNTSSFEQLIISLFHAIPTTYAHRGAWMMNRNMLAMVRSCKTTVGQPLVVDRISEAFPQTLFGRPVIEMPDMDDWGEGNTPIIFGDLSGYRIVDRVGLSTLRDPFSLATVGQVRFHARKRVGADVTHPDRFVKLTVAA
jgi:HK97 family phage major capsid protein/HK97 family phage prohead protease